MAKGNLFLGTAARSVGDVVIYRREGSQVSRVRVRKIANPKTDAQCEQRAFMSAVVKFYQPLANVLDRSWQGLSRAKSYAKFLKTNANIVRAGGYYVPKSAGFTPLPLQVSNGTLAPCPVPVFHDFYEFDFTAPSSATTPATLGEASAILIGCGFKAGDVITVILIGKDSENNYIPMTYQFEIDTQSTVPSTTRQGSMWPMLSVQDGEFKFAFESDYSQVAATMIVARNVDGSWYRSKQFLSVQASVLALFTSNEAKATTIDSYKGAAASDNPLVYLDGDELDNA